MIISCIGHAMFLLELENGMRIVTDPYDAPCGYPVMNTPADLVLVSHGHHDHNALDTIPGTPKVVDHAGVYDFDEVRVTAVDASHDEVGGEKRGRTLLFVVEAEGLRVMHLGDLGEELSPEQLAQLGRADVVMIPVGGYYTIDAAAAIRTARALGARVVLPMHYRTAANPTWPIAPVEAFEALLPERPEHLPLLRIAQGDLSCQPFAAVLEPVSLKA